MFSYIRLPAPSPILNREEEQKRFWLNRPVITYCRKGVGGGRFWEYHMVVRGVTENKEGMSRRLQSIKGVL